MILHLLLSLVWFILYLVVAYNMHFPGILQELPDDLNLFVPRRFTKKLPYLNDKKTVLLNTTKRKSNFRLPQ